MNIKKAKDQIKNSMKAYLTKNEFNDYLIPVERQRPIFLMGPPGVGKTAIMEQVAGELGVGLIPYSMTHHTRQSAIGLPFIKKRVYGGKEYEVSEYTMSEIIASVYNMMEQTGLKEGILFLDEINCVSETLAPAMLQFLQYKIFGLHKVPKGWIVVTAGNPPEYNNSVREFDIVTWDRLRRIDVEPDYDVWKEYAYKKDVHAAIITYLDIKTVNFYSIETSVDGKSFVTARGWSDLSDIMKVYEKEGIPVDENLFSQYLQNRKIAKDFAIYYDLFNKYKSDYQIDKILADKAAESIKERAKLAKFDERLTLLGLLLEGISFKFQETYYKEQKIEKFLDIIKNMKKNLAFTEDKNEELLAWQISEIKDKIENGKLSYSISEDDEYVYQNTISILEKVYSDLEGDSKNDIKDIFSNLNKTFDDKRTELKKYVKEVGKELSNIFIFCNEVFGDGQEMLILVTELTISFYGANFISHYGCKEYFNHNKELLFYERHKDIEKELESLDI